MVRILKHVICMRTNLASYDTTGISRKSKSGGATSSSSASRLKDRKRVSVSSLTTDEVLERIQQQMAEVMATAHEAANSAVTNENEARAVAAIELKVLGRWQHNVRKYSDLHGQNRGS